MNIAFLKDDRLYRAERRVKVPAVSRQLTVTVTAEPPSPAAQARALRDQGRRRQRRARARAVQRSGVIDEAVYGVKADDTPDPLRFFYQRNYSRVGTTFSREYSFVGYSGTQQMLLAMRKRPYSLADFKADKPAQPQVRKEFPDAIYWVADLVTDAARRGVGPGDVPGRADDVAADRARRDGRHARRAGRRAHDGHEGSDRARDHAAFPHRGRRGR